MNPSNGQTPLDYLNQIAPQAPKKAGFGLNMKTVLLGGGILVVLVIILSVIATSAGGGRKSSFETMVARINATETVASNSNKLIKNSQLRSLNSELSLYITNTKRDMTTPIANYGIDTTKLSPTVVAAETGTGMTERLETGRLNAKYDSTYAREMNYQLQRLLALYQQLYNSSRSTSEREFLEKAYDNLKPTQESIANFSASNE